MVSAKKSLDSKVQTRVVDRERGAWKKYYLEKLKEREDECRRSLCRTKARLEVGKEACLVELTHRQSAVMDDVRTKIWQTSSEATQAFAHLAEDTTGCVSSTPTFNVRAELNNVVRKNLPANGGGR